jgi:hypothetical protein
VTKHLATYISVGVKTTGTKREVVRSIAYPSEPILAVASAFGTTTAGKLYGEDDALGGVAYRCSKEKVLATVKRQLESSISIVKMNKGDLASFWRVP